MTWSPAFIVSSHSLYGTITGTSWISNIQTGLGTRNADTWYRIAFQLPPCFSNASLNIQINADNAATIYLNSPPTQLDSAPNLIGGQTIATLVSNVNGSSTFSTADPDLFQPGTNILIIRNHNFDTFEGIDYRADVTFTDPICLNGTHTYSPKFVCVPEVGPVGGALVPQNYSTVVNVHNPHSSNVTFVKKAVIAQSEDERRGNISELVEDRLEPDQALSIDCTDIVGLFDTTSPSPVGDGFVVLNSNQTLDVSAVYTTRDSIDVENIQPTTTNDTDNDIETQLPDLTIRLPERTSITGPCPFSICIHTIPVEVRNLASMPVTNPFQVQVSTDNGISRTLTVPSLSEIQGLH